jgi:hypothetical protein
LTGVAQYYQFQETLFKMLKHSDIYNTREKKYHSLKKKDNFCRAEIKLGEFDPIYQIRLNDINGDEACFFVKQDSFIFDKLKAGKVLEMSYWTGENVKATKFVKARVKNIIKQNQEIPNGRYLVQLSIPKREQPQYCQKSSLDQSVKLHQSCMP